VILARKWMSFGQILVGCTCFRFDICCEITTTSGNRLSIYSTCHHVDNNGMNAERMEKVERNNHTKPGMGAFEITVLLCSAAANKANSRERFTITQHLEWGLRNNSTALLWSCKWSKQPWEINKKSSGLAILHNQDYIQHTDAKLSNPMLRILAWVRRIVDSIVIQRVEYCIATLISYLTRSKIEHFYGNEKWKFMESLRTTLWEAKMHGKETFSLAYNLI